jgi:hypothetical protein
MEGDGMDQLLRGSGMPAVISELMTYLSAEEKGKVAESSRKKKVRN